MYERFTDHARKVMALANSNARRFGHEYVGTEHILLGLVEEGQGVAANVLKNLGLDLRKLRQEVEVIVQGGPRIEVVLRTFPLTPRAKKIIEYAREESLKLGHSYVGSEHLLLGTLREQDGVAAQVLLNLGLTLQGVRNEVLNLLGQNPTSPVGTSPQIKLPKSEMEKMEASMMFTGDDAEEKMRHLFGPGHIDQFVRQAVQTCWMMLPKDKRTTEELENQIRRLFERGLRDFREDSQAFGG
jgi:ATP-dependent Clp protease ATP-binding subunit ClpA